MLWRPRVCEVSTVYCIICHIRLNLVPCLYNRVMSINMLFIWRELVFPSQRLIGHSACIENLPDRTRAELANFTIETYTIDELSTRQQRQYIFPSIRFSCSGMITKWRFTSPDISEGNGRPEISVWRETGNSTGRHDKVSSQVLGRCPVEKVTVNTMDILIQENYANASLLTFERGDTLGLFVRRDNIAQFRPYFYEAGEDVMSYHSLDRQSPIDSITESNERAESILPVLSIEICECLGSQYGCRQKL